MAFGEVVARYGAPFVVPLRERGVTNRTIRERDNRMKACLGEAAPPDTTELRNGCLADLHLYLHLHLHFHLHLTPHTSTSAP
ncbi:hypothetical protein NGM37_40930, partial [Streptomyces sp. TRM76130]|nr:hypothetical protein [Streptomyces sp. TRM76130]